MSIYLYIGLIFYLFITTTTASFFGIKQAGAVSISILLSLFVYYFLATNGKILFRKKLSEEKYVLMIGIFIIFIRIAMSDHLAVFSTFYFLVLPIVIFLLINAQKYGVKNSVKGIILFFFFIECFLAIYERIFLINLFPYPTDNITNNVQESWMFRSTALLGHPLNNALIVSTILGFILVENYKVYFKLFSMCLGIVSLLCFNARGAIVIWLILGSMFIFNLIFSRSINKSSKFLLILLSIASISAIFYLIYFTSLGGRILNESELIDGSALTRIDAFKVFSFMNVYDLILGKPSNYLLLTNKLNAAGIENSYIVVIIKYGIVFGLFIIFSLYRLVKKVISMYDNQRKFYIIVSFILVGSLNNSLSAETPWVIFLLCVSSSNYAYIRTVNILPRTTVNMHLNI